MRLRTLLVALAGAAVVVAAVPAGAVAGRPVVSDPYPVNWCGEVPGTAVNIVNVSVERNAAGVMLANERATFLFTATATGKSIEASAAGVSKLTITDNGNGTTTYAGSGAGLALTFKIPNGPILKDASGKPIIGAGEVTFTEVVDNATGADVSFTSSFRGPHPLAQGVDICGPSVAYLLDP